MLNAYFLDQQGNILCYDCGCDTDGAEQHENNTNRVYVCSCCGQDIPFARQQLQYAARRILSAAEWDLALH